MPEITPPFTTFPRDESFGEKRARYSVLVSHVAHDMGLKLSPSETEHLAGFVLNVVAKLTPAQQKAVADLVGKGVAWAVHQYTGK